MPLAPLSQRDLILHEQFLKDVFSRFLSFKTYSLFFPPTADDPMAAGFGEGYAQAAHLPAERKVLTPLVAEGRLLGVFVARGASLPAPRTMLPLLPRIGAMALTQLALTRAAAADELTGLASGDTLTRALTREIELVQDRILPGSASLVDPGLTGLRGGFGLVALDLDGFSRLAARYGFMASEAALARVGGLLERTCPEGGLAARLHDDLYGLFLPGASAARCRETAEGFLRELSRLAFPVRATGEQFSLTASAGCAMYPQDMRGGQFVAPPAEQARLLLGKAKRALSVAKDLGRDQVMAYHRILAEGGVVLETLPLSRISVSHGRGVDAEAGQRFLIWSPRDERTLDIRKSDGERLSGRYPTTIKGEAVLMDVGEDMAFAEVLQLTDPHWPIEPGDRLLLAPEAEAAPPGGDAGPPRRDMVSGLYGHHDFLRVMASDREKRQAFTLILVLLPEVPSERRAGRPAEADMAEAAATCRMFFGPDAVGGRFSSSKLVFYLPERDPATLLEAAETAVGALAERLGVTAAMGLAGYPFLHFSRADVPENCRKALDHALLLPKGPRLAVFDSLSLTVSGDRLFAMGDIYAAMEEYKQALLADEGNTLARNSLGICLAKLGRLPQARAEFTQVIGRDAKNTMALYNLGCVSRRLGENAAARSAFQKCLRANPGHVYSLLRLGRMAEESRRFDAALKYYKRAAGAKNGPALTLRHLARLAFKRGRLDEAREHLHQALLHDPKDAFSLHLMARLYLEEGQDPAIAEAMARQAVALRPDHGEFWKELAQALSVQGKADESREALARAEGV
uniref:GGDEF domain-containing protein n=1 Tax=Desulfovibrio sp. U5L TaxID=596152 RepID=I2Q670_9BACT